MTGCTQAVLISETPGIGRDLLLSGRGRQRILRRRDHIQIQREQLAFEMIQSQRHLLPVQFGEAELGPVTRPDQHVAQAGIQAGLSLGIGLDPCDGTETAIVEYLILHFNPRERGLIFIDDRHHGLAGGHIVADHIDLGIDRVLDDHVLGALVVTGDLGMQQQRAGHGTAEPAHVQLGIRLTGAQVMPLPVHPGLDPGMVAVGMGPERRVDLPGRDTGRPKGTDGEGRFLAAAALAGSHQRERGPRPRIRAGIGRPFMAPVIDFQDRIVQGQPLHALAELVRIEHAEAVEVLVVDPHRQHEMAEFPLGDPPGHLLPHLQGLVHDFLPIGPVIDQAVRGRHIPVQIVHIAVPPQRLVRRTGERKRQTEKGQDPPQNILSHISSSFESHPTPNTGTAHIQTSGRHPPPWSASDGSPWRKP